MSILSSFKYPIIFFVFMGLAFYSGWKVNSYYVGYQQNLEKIVQESIDKGVTEFQKKQAQGLEDSKNILNNLETKTIYKENTIINQPIYSNECMDQAGVDIVEGYKKESSFIINNKKAPKK